MFAKTNLEVISVYHFSIQIVQRCLGKKIAFPAASKPRIVIPVNTENMKRWGGTLNVWVSEEKLEAF